MESIEIPLLARDGSVRAWAIIDQDDYEWVSQWKWCLHSEGYVCRNRSRSHPEGRALLLLHRELFEFPPGDPRQVDHRDRNRLNNRRNNLRETSLATNPQNTNGWKTRKSKYRGVTYRPSINKRNPWVARVMVAGKVHSSYHSTEEEAGERAQSIRENKMPFSEV